LLGLLLFSTPASAPVSPTQIERLETLAAVVSHACRLALQNEAHDQAALTHQLRFHQLELARDLHDTLGQNISYLRMHLARVAANGTTTSSDAASAYTHLVKVADESYDLLRANLAMLQSNGSADLQHLFSRYAEEIADRSALRLRFASQGTGRPLSPRQQRHLFYAFREALSNIERHAQATRIMVELAWNPSQLSLVIADNGQGFDPAAAPAAGHYGLRFMRERISALGGTVSVATAIGEGTRLMLCVPLDPLPQPVVPQEATDARADR
jgi:two-component system nitrate/nitrite sensor histidine kinase NarX